MATLAVIPARLAATRLPRKPLRLLSGEPIIVRVWQRISAMGVADSCVVATDSDEVRTACERAGAQVVMTDAAHPSGTDRVAEVARSPRFASFDTVVNVQGDEPFVSEEAVRGAASLVSSGRFPVGTVAARASANDLDSPDCVKVVFGDDARALYFSRAPIPWLRDTADSSTRETLMYRHIGVYAYNRDALMQWVALAEHPLERTEKLEQLRPLAAGIAIGVAVVAQPPLPGIDTEADLVFANERWNVFTSGTR